jgi:hypothetical protein
VDYSKSTQFVYALAVKVHIGIHQDLGVAIIGTKAPEYTASGGEKSYSRFSDDLKVMFFRGFKIGEIDKICV